MSYLYPDSERMEVFFLSTSIQLSFHSAVVGLILAFTSAEEQEVVVELRKKDFRHRPSVVPEANSKKILAKQGVIEFLRVRFLGKDSSELELKEQQTEAERRELLRYLEEKRKLQKNLNQIWKKRVEKVQNFQIQKAENDLKQSQFFRDNFEVRTNIREVMRLQEVNWQRRHTFALQWRQILLVLAMPAILQKKIEHSKYIQGINRTHIRQIWLFLRKVGSVWGVDQPSTVVRERAMLEASLTTRRNFGLVAAKLGAKKVVSGILWAVHKKIVLQEKIFRFSARCELNRRST